jgi:hypothetical protein
VGILSNNKMRYNLKPAKHIKIYRIYLNGEPVSVISGKDRWNAIGHAKSALRRHLYIYFRDETDYTGKELRSLIDKTMLEFKFVSKLN